MRLPVCIEAALLVGVAAYITYRQETITAVVHRTRERDAGLTVLGALAGAALAHLILEEPREHTRSDPRHPSHAIGTA